MISLKNIRENKDEIYNKLALKNYNAPDLDKVFDLDKSWRVGLSKVEKLKEIRNSSSKQISEYKNNNKPVDELIKEMQSVSSKIKEIDLENIEIKNKIDKLLLEVPNTPHSSVPIGKSDKDNIIVRDWGKKPTFNFKVDSHIEIAEKLNLLDFKASAKISGSGFSVYTNLGARLERSLINFMLDHHTNHGYKEIFPPFLATHTSMETTGQIPKLIEDMYYIGKDDLFCIPTAEVPVTNYYRDEEVDENLLPIKFAAYSACFRREAGSYGKDTKGLLRLHQFNKVELVKFSSPEDSYDELEALLADAEEILRLLGLHYRIKELCTGDLSFSSSKCYDIEVWSPFEEKYLEVSSCSNFENFQAYRGNMKFRSSKTGKLDFLHTLNGSGLATPRLMVALLENYQQKDGTILIPEPLKTYMGTSIISNE